MFKTYWSIFWRTFSLAAAALLGTSSIYQQLVTDYKVGTDVVLAGLIMAAVAGLLAAGYAWITTPATSPIAKALRQATQVALGVLATVAITVPSDILELGPVLVPGVIATVLAFFVTFFANQAPAPATTDAGTNTVKDFVGSA